MSKQTFRWRVDSAASVTHKFAVRTVKFGDGYEQRQATGLRPKMQMWDVQLSGRKELLEEIKAFLDARRGVESFYWQPPGRPRLLVKTADEYRETHKGGKVYQLAVKFEEVLA
ncbi:phage tail protein [Neisseria dentiae]|uniref:phage tail protein n=1 Tax=Neisseria dentiae TaxID=194197 RepID=UPI00211CD4EE|nr:phage tail protein [Neisseria dentiae]MCQ9325517.1 phage tail protein [Neisseria dentiae]